MSMKEFNLDGKNMTSVENFSQEVQNVLCPSFHKREEICMHSGMYYEVDLEPLMKV